MNETLVKQLEGATATVAPSPSPFRPEVIAAKRPKIIPPVSIAGDPAMQTCLDVLTVLRTRQEPTSAVQIARHLSPEQMTSRDLRLALDRLCSLGLLVRLNTVIESYMALGEDGR
jgi:hypothetical protein